MLYRRHELAIRTLYAEVKERARGVGELLRGTPGNLVKREGTGYPNWYRMFYPSPKKQVEEYVGTARDHAAYQQMQDRIAHSAWTAKQVSTLSKVGYQVADRGVAAVLTELHNKGLFSAGLLVVGTLAYMAWLNEFGAMAAASRTHDIDLARRQHLKLAGSVSFLSSVRASHLPFVRIPGMPSHEPSTSVKLPGVEGLRVDVLAPGAVLGQTVAVPELDWHAQAVPHFDYLLEDSLPAAMLAGGHCITVMLPQPVRMIWHKLYSSVSRTSDPTKAEKDLRQAVTLAAILVEEESVNLEESFGQAPRVLRNAASARRPRIEALLEAHPQARDNFRSLW